MKSALVCKLSFVAMAVLCLAATIAAVGLMPRSANAQEIVSSQWLEAKYEGLDSFYGMPIVAYQAGDVAKVTATVFNGYDHDATLDYARLSFGWGGSAIDATTKLTPIPKDSYALFVWEFTVPGTASNLITHTWEITVKFTVEADTPFDVTDSTSGSNFVVYSADQSACRDSVDTWNANNEAYTIWGYKGREMMTEALSLYNKAEDQYNSGKFGDANTSYADAVTKQDEAIKADAKSALTDQSAEALRGTGGTKGTAYLIAGIGILLAGVGVIVGALLRGMRGNKPA